MDTLGYHRIHLSIKEHEDRVQALLRERRLRAKPERASTVPVYRPDGARRWSIASLVGLVMAKR